MKIQQPFEVMPIRFIASSVESSALRLLKTEMTQRNAEQSGRFSVSITDFFQFCPSNNF